MKKKGFQVKLEAKSLAVERSRTIWLGRSVLNGPRYIGLTKQGMIKRNETMFRGQEGSHTLMTICSM